MKTGHEDRHVFQFFFVIALIIIARKHQRLRLSKEKKIKRCDTIRINRLNQLHLPSGWLIPDVKKNLAVRSVCSSENEMSKFRRTCSIYRIYSAATGKCSFRLQKID